jgi:repressor LexA
MQVIDDSERKNGYLPSLREIGDAVGLASTSSVYYQLSVLEKQGLVTRSAGRPRTAKVRPAADQCEYGNGPGAEELLAHIPLVGRIAAGIPITAEEQRGEIVPLPRMLTGEGELIMLSVSGDSMTGAAIADGDWVVVRRQPDAENGAIVAAQIDSDTAGGCEATVKTLSRQDGHTWLVPQNPAYPPILGDHATIIGKVVTVLRRV